MSCAWVGVDAKKIGVRGKWVGVERFADREVGTLGFIRRAHVWIIAKEKKKYRHAR